jgi:hypothetical protein
LRLSLSAHACARIDKRPCLSWDLRDFARRTNRCASPTPSVEDPSAEPSLSRLSSPQRSRLPESFQGGCSFGGGHPSPLSSAEGRLLAGPHASRRVGTLDQIVASGWPQVNAQNGSIPAFFAGLRPFPTSDPGLQCLIGQERVGVGPAPYGTRRGGRRGGPRSFRSECGGRRRSG